MSRGLSYPLYSPATQNPTALSDVYRLFSTSVYLSSHSSSVFDAIFEYITNMIGRLFYLHIVKSTPNNQAWKIRGSDRISDDIPPQMKTLNTVIPFTFSYVFILLRKM